MERGGEGRWDWMMMNHRWLTIASFVKQKRAPGGLKWLHMFQVAVNHVKRTGYTRRKVNSELINDSAVRRIDSVDDSTNIERGCRVAAIVSSVHLLLPP